MVVDPITIGVVLAVVVAFLQTKFSLKVRKVGGKVDVEFSVSKDATSEDTIKRVITRHRCRACTVSAGIRSRGRRRTRRGRQAAGLAAS